MKDRWVLVILAIIGFAGIGLAQQVATSTTKTLNADGSVTIVTTKTQTVSAMQWIYAVNQERTQLNSLRNEYGSDEAMALQSATILTNSINAVNGT